MKKLIMGILMAGSIMANASELPPECKNPVTKNTFIEKRKCAVGECVVGHIFGESARLQYGQIDGDEVNLNPDRYAEYPFNTYSFAIKSGDERMQCFQANLESCSVYECEIGL